MKKALTQGTKAGIIALILGLLVMVFYPPLKIGFVVGAVIGTFVGNFIGCLLAGNN